MKDAIPGRTLSVACGDSCSPFCRLPATSSPGRGKSFHSGRALGRTGRFRPHRSTAGRSLPLSCKLFAPAKVSPFRERWHGEAVTERVASGTNPLSLAALDSQFPFLSPGGDIFPRPGEVFPLRWSPWQRGQVSSSPVNGRKKPAVKQHTFRPCQSLSLSGEVSRRSRDGEGCFRDEPSQSPTATASSPFCRLRGEGGFQDEPSQSPTATALPKGEPLAEPAGLVLIRQRQEKACR